MSESKILFNAWMPADTEEALAAAEVKNRFNLPGKPEGCTAAMENLASRVLAAISS